MKRQFTIEVICLLFIFLFVYAAVSKLLDVEKFRVQLGQSPMITAFASWVAIGIPSIEIMIAFVLPIPSLRLFGLFASFTLMVMFTAYIVAITEFAEYVPCSCGGVLQKLGWTEHLLFNAGFTILAVAGILLETGRTQLPPVAVDGKGTAATF